MSLCDNCIQGRCIQQTQYHLCVGYGCTCPHRDLRDPHGVWDEMIREGVKVPAEAYKAALGLLTSLMDAERQGPCPLCAALNYADWPTSARVVRAALDHSDPAAQVAAVKLLRGARGGGA